MAILLHHHAPAAAAGLLLAAVDIHRLGWSVQAGGAAAARRVALHLAVISPDLAHNVVEGLVDIDAGLGRRLDELAAERLGKRFALCAVETTNVSASQGRRQQNETALWAPTLPRYLPLALQIALVAYHHHGEVVLVLDTQDLLLEGGDFLEALSRRDGVD